MSNPRTAEEVLEILNRLRSQPRDMLGLLHDPVGRQCAVDAARLRFERTSSPEDEKLWQDAAAAHESLNNDPVK